MWFPGGPVGAGPVLSTAIAAGLTVIVQTTVLLALGLFVSVAMKRQGPVAQSYVLRVVLVFAALSTIMVAFGISERAIMVPVPSLPARSADMVSDDGIRPVDEESPRSSVPLRDGNVTAVSPPVQYPRPDIIRTQPEPPDDAQASFSATPVSSPVIPPLPEAIAPAAGDVPPHSVAQVIHVPGAFLERIVRLLYIGFILLWGVMSLSFLVQTLREILYLWRLRHAAQPVSTELIHECRRAAALLGVSCPEIRQSPLLVSPIISGIRHPMILLPSTLDGGMRHPTEVFLHELTHLKRHDQFWCHLRQALLIAIPVQPLMWLLARRLNETDDYVCDAIVTSHTRDRRAYATTLFTIASQYAQFGGRPAPGIGMMAFASPLRRRIERILKSTGEISFRLSPKVLAAASLLCTASAAVSGVIGFESRAMIPDDVRRMTASPVSRDETSGRNQLLVSESTTALKAVFQTTEVSAASLSAEGNDSQAAQDDQIVMGTGDMVSAIGEDSAALSPDVTAIHDEMPETSTSDSAQDTEQMTAVADQAITGDSAVTSGTSRVEPAISEPASPEPADDGWVAGELIPDTGPGGSVRGDGDSSYLSGIGGLELSSVSEIRIVVPTARALAVSVPEYRNGMFDLSDPEQFKQYNIYASLDKNKNEPAWSPDGGTIVFTDQNRIWLVEATGGDPELIFENFHEEDGRRFPIGGIESISFTPDGRSLVFKLDRYDRTLGSRITIRQVDETHTNAYFDQPIPTIVCFDLVTGRLTKLADGGYNCAVSQDGSAICYLAADLPLDTDDASILYHPVLLDLETGQPHVLNDNPGLVFGRPAFSPDGESLIIPCREGRNEVSLCRMPVTGGEPEPLTSVAIDGGSGAYIGVPTCSPDGNWVMFTDFSLVPDRPNKRLMLYSTVSGEVFEMFPDAVDRRSYGTWSPDGNAICYLTTEPGGNALYVCRFEPRLYKIASPAGTATPAESLAFNLDEPFPNPFNNAVTLRFTLPEPGEVRLNIYSVTGQHVAELARGQYEPGTHALVWDGSDQTGRQLSSGVYIARIIAGGHLETKKMTLAK